MGIEALKSTTVHVLQLGADFYEVFEDGKFNILTESFQLGKSLIAELPPIIRNAKAALTEIKELTPAEFRELADYIQQHFDIADDQIEAKIEAGLDQVVKLHATIVSIVEYGKTLKKAAA